VVTVHDLIYKVFPEAHFGLRSLGLSVLVPLAVKTAHRIIAVSDTTRRDLETRLRVPADKVDVVPQGHGDRMMSGDPMPEADLRRTLDLGDRRVLLTLSAFRPHKNLARLLRALASIPDSERPVLVMPGYPTGHEAELKQLAGELDLGADVRFPGWTPRATIEGLYTMCACFVFPSLYEGFGAPVVEAMARGVPVACSNRGAVAEVAGGAAALFDPDSPEDIARAIVGLLTDDTLAARLRREGPERARVFNWERTAQGALATYRRALEK
jgi:glycosyltransferase involved in cell wall biosynthesis